MTIKLPSARRSLLLICLDGVRPPDPTPFKRAGFEVGVTTSPDDAVARVCDVALVVAPRPPPILDLLTRLVPARRRLPVLCVTTAAAPEEIALLEAGASLCLAPGLADGELMDRTRHLLRLALGQPRRPQLGDLEIDPGRRQAWWRGVAIPLRPVEFDLLLALGERAGEPVTTASLASALWPGADGATASRRLSVHLHHLRRALAVTARRPLLHTRPNGIAVLSATTPGARRRPG